MRFALVTDVHFGPAARYAGKLRKLTHLAEELTRTVAREIAERHRPELLVNLGDVIEDASREEDRAHYREFLAAIAGARTPLLHVAGNHDQVHLTGDDLRELWGRAGPLYGSWDVGGVHLATLCTRFQDGVEITVPEEQIRWLAQDLGATALPTVVLLHHPLAEMDLRGSRWFEHEPHLCGVANRAAVREVIARSGVVVAVINGHVHWSHVGVHDGIPYVTLQSLTENLDEDAPGRPARTYAIAEVDATGFRLRAYGDEPLRVDVGR